MIHQAGFGAKCIGTCTYLYLSAFFRVLACTLYLCFENVLVPKYITTYLVLEDKYIASTSVLLKKNVFHFTFSVIQCNSFQNSYFKIIQLLNAKQI